MKYLIGRSLALLALLLLPSNLVFAQIEITPRPYINGSGVAAGPIQLVNGSCASALESLYFANSTNTGIYSAGAGTTSLCGSGNHIVDFTISGIDILRDSGRLSFGSATDLIIKRNTAGILEQVNGTNPQSFYVDLTNDGAGNSEFGFLDWNTGSSILRIGTSKTGTGSARGMRINIGGSDKWSFDTSGNLATLGNLTESLLYTSLGTTSTDAVILSNTTAATNGIPVQISPRIRQRGTVWDTAASETVDFFTEVLPVTAATPTGLWKLGYSLNGAGATYPLTVSSAGDMVIGTISTNVGSITSGLSLISASGGQIRWNGRLQMNSIANGQINFRNDADNAGFGLDVLTDAVAKFRTRAQTGYATVDALAYQASGTALTSGTTFLSNGSGMAVANVGANSCGTTTATIAGNNNANVTTVGATAGTQCRIAFTIAAATEWDCAASDDTTTVAVRTTPVDTTHTDIIGTFTAGDKVTAICFAR